MTYLFQPFGQDAEPGSDGSGQLRVYAHREPEVTNTVGFCDGCRTISMEPWEARRRRSNWAITHVDPKTLRPRPRPNPKPLRRVLERLGERLA